MKLFNNKYIIFHFEKYNSHVFKSLFIFKVMLAFNRGILVNVPNITMNVTTNFSLQKSHSYQTENVITLTGIKVQSNRKVFTRISNIFNRNY